MIIVASSNKHPLPNLFFIFTFLSFFLFYQCYFARDVLQIFKQIFQQNLFSLAEIFLSLLSPTQHLPLSAIFTHLSRFVDSLVSTNYKGILYKLLRQSTTNQYTSKNSRFAACQENYVTMGKTLISFHDNDKLRKILSVVP